MKILVLCLFVLVELSTTVLSNPVANIEWKEHKQVCKKMTVYKSRLYRNYVSCLQDCAKDGRCAMVKYSNTRHKCWFSNTPEIRASDRCKESFDFYIKAGRLPVNNWIERVQSCSKARHYAKFKANSVDYCKIICAKDSLCAMVWFLPEKRKCVLSKSRQISESNRCPKKRDFYLKGHPTPRVTWIEHLDICAKAKVLVILHAVSLKQCKENCAREPKCAMVKYSKNKNRCSLHKTNKLRGGTCERNYDFYEKDACAHNPCNGASLCLNNGTGADCVKSCPVGFSKHGKVCKDSCAQNVCKGNLLCLNKGTKSSCVTHCPDGFSQAGKTCEDIDECANPKTCGHHEKCENLVGHHKCVCKKGYKRHGQVCVQVLEQSIEMDGIPFKRGQEAGKPSSNDPTTESVNWIAHGDICAKISSFEVISGIETADRCREICEQQVKCVLVEYQQDSKMCSLSHSRRMKRVKECRVRHDYYIKGSNECGGKRSCHSDAICQTTAGHTLCQCLYGYKGDGFDCQDIDECSEYTKICSEHARCRNTLGSFRCKCNRGWIGDGKTCTQKSRKNSKHDQKREKMRKLIAEWKAEHSNAVPTRCGLTQIVTAILLVIGGTFY